MTKPYKNFIPSAYTGDMTKGTITQFFGENPALYKDMCADVQTHSNCMVGGHNGWDCVDAWGTPIMCVMSGRVVEVKDDATGYGKHIRILSNIGDKSLEWVYGHLSRIDVVLGQALTEGAQIGLMGNTGFVVSGATPYWKYNPYAGTHLHLGVREVWNWVSGSWDVSYATGDKGTMLNYSNGFLGSIDVQPFFTNLMPTYDPSKYTLTGQSIINQLKLLYAKLNGN